MASDKNSPQKGQDNINPDSQKPTEVDAVDWMIISDLSTRIGGSPQRTPESQIQSSKISNNQVSNNQISNNQNLNDDIEDLEWLRSLDLDEPIKRSPSQKNASGNLDSNSDVGNIDWLIVTDLKTRMDDSEIRAKANSQYQGATQPKTILQSSTPIDILQIDNLSGNVLEDDLGLEGLEFLENSDFSDLDSLGFSNSDDFGADDLLEDTDVTEGNTQGLSEFLNDNFESNSTADDNDWESILGITENSNEPFNLDLASDSSLEMSTQISEIVNNDEDYYDNAALVSEEISEELGSQFDEPICQEDIQEDLIDNFDSPAEDLDNNLDDGFGEVRSLQSLDSSMLGDEVWESSSSSLESETFNQSTDDIFVNDWEPISENPDNDPIWDSPASIDPNAILTISIDNTFDNFDTFDDFDQQAIAPPPAEYFEVEANISQVIPNDINDQADLAIASGLEDDFEPVSDGNWSVDLEAEIGRDTDVVWDDQLIATEDYLESIESVEEPDELSNDLSFSEQSFEQSINAQLIDQLADQQFNEVISEPVVDSDFLNPEISAVDYPKPDDVDEIESIINENFDLATFDEDNFPAIPLTENISNIIATTLTPNRAIAIPFPEDALDDLPPTNDLFEEALVSDLLSGGYEAEIDFAEEALAYDLLNDFPVEVVDSYISEPQIPSPPSANFASTNFTPNIASSPSNFEMPDSDFLDDFDLDSVGVQLTDDGFDSGFESSTIPTGLTPLPPPSPPPIIVPEPTSPTINTPPPPPFLPPLPPKRNSNQANQVKAPAISASVPNVSSYSQPQNRIGEEIGEDDFDNFHDQQGQVQQNESHSLINSMDKGWSELLDADTVISGVLKSPTQTSFSDTSGAIPPKARVNLDRTSQGRDRSVPSNTSRRRETKLPDFNDLGLEIHDDNTDWSGLLDSGDLSDSITTISHQSNQTSRIRGNQSTSSRLDATGINETREIPRDRRSQMSSFGDATQARMNASPDQMDFNRFTEDNYDAYETPAAAPAKVAPSRPKIAIPSVSLESLWQNYLKIPAIGLGAIGGVFLLYLLVSRPIFDLGLRWGIFKDATGKDFTNADFKGAKLDNVDFSKAILTGAKMQDASLVGANFQEANLDGVNFAKANLSRARLIKASVIWAEFNNAQMNLVDLEGADLTRSNFGSAKMEGVNLKGSKIGVQGTEKATIFSSTTLLAWQIVNEPKEGRNLTEQNLSGLNLSFTSLKRANLSNAKLNYADMTGTDLSGANLLEGQVNGANWSGAKLNGINLTGVIFDKNKLPKTDEETVCPNGKKGPCKF